MTSGLERFDLAGLRAYPNNPAARKAMIAQAKCKNPHVVLRLLVPAGKDSAKTIHPAMRPFNDPAACPFALLSFQGISVFCGVGERMREGHELWSEMRSQGITDNSVLVLGQMCDSPGFRFRSMEGALESAEAQIRDLSALYQYSRQEEIIEIIQSHSLSDGKKTGEE